MGTSLKGVIQTATGNMQMTWCVVTKLNRTDPSQTTSTTISEALWSRLRKCLYLCQHRRPKTLLMGMIRSRIQITRKSVRSQLLAAWEVTSLLCRPRWLPWGYQQIENAKYHKQKWTGVLDTIMALVALLCLQPLLAMEYRELVAAVTEET